MSSDDRYGKSKSFGKTKPLVDGIFMFAKVTVTSVTLIVALIVSVLFFLVLMHLSRVPDLSVLDNYRPGGSLEIYDVNNKLVCVFPAKEKRSVVPLELVSKNLVFAVLAAEDHYFYEHHGISAEGVMRATLANVNARRPVQGGSTLTQ
ncbi:MAG: transglycosylase domain-containing protein, partial [Cyanobacteria bacterium]|nr:transglycosylase domain-containing protein [Cyanobacteriota bacterium]